MIKRTIKKILSVVIIISMIFTSSGIYTFANVEADTDEKIVGADIIRPDSNDDTKIFDSEDIEEENVGANYVSPEDEIEEETTEEIETTVGTDTDEKTVGADIIRPDSNDDTKIFDSEDIEESDVGENCVSPKKEITGIELSMIS